jgi:uncharacterized protein
MMSGRDDLAIFPLKTVLFPEGALPLRIFEARYMDMARECLRDEKPFGVCLIADGSEVGGPAVPQSIGTTARIAQWDMQDLGVLQVVVRGGQRFRILSHDRNRQGLVRATVEWLAEESACAIPPALDKLVPLLEAMVDEVGTDRVPEPHRFDDAVWVGHRYAELLPIPLIARQKLLELDDALSRLEIVFQYLGQHGLMR